MEPEGPPAAPEGREARLLDAEIELQRTSAELEDFVYTVSHDLNGPLISILGYADLFETDFGESLPEEARFYLERIKASGKFMQALINDLLELSRIGRVHTEPETVDLEALIHEIAEEIGSDAPDVKVNVRRSPPIHLNPVRAKQLFTHLIDNSVKHAGRPDVTIDVLSQGTSGGRATFHVIDDGPGIPPVQREKVFGVFERLDPSRSGTGMGLALCKRICESNGGEISIVKSESGTVVQLILPVSDTEGSNQ
jgi:signal transduction histidine kinase